ncbi:unnamed protein product [Durusdinium trenchii]|uniref:Uncharacterized protein n=2 Tax=Durusdinium trenchii TaxID=1381693 RepID=A0ABP0JJR1_9DINO
MAAAGAVPGGPPKPSHLAAPAPPGKPASIDTTEAIHPSDPAVQLCLPTFYDTIKASAIGGLFLLAGLFAWSISEAGIPGVAKERWFVLLFRFLGWVAVYFLPVHLVAVGNLRGFNVHGSIPDNSALVCLRTGLGPHFIAEAANLEGYSAVRAVAGTLMISFLCLLIYAAFIFVYIGEEHEHLGFVFVYGVGHIVVIAGGEIVAPAVLPDPLNKRYSQKMGPATLGVALVGFFIVTASYSVVKRFIVGFWLGALMPAMLSLYEMGCLLLLQRTFTREFIEERWVRRAYQHTNQGVLVSVQIALVHAMAEGARMTLILSDMLHSARSNLDFLVPVLSTLAWNILVRVGMLDRALAIVTCGRRTPTRCSLLLQEVKYSMGLPRFFVVLAIVLARVLSRNPMLLVGEETAAYAILAIFLAEVVENVVSYILEWLDYRVHPTRRQITESEVEVMAWANLKLSQHSNGTPFPVIPARPISDSTNTDRRLNERAMLEAAREFRIFLRDKRLWYPPILGTFCSSHGGPIPHHVIYHSAWERAELYFGLLF